MNREKYNSSDQYSHPPRKNYSKPNEQTSWIINAGLLFIPGLSCIGFPLLVAHICGWDGIGKLIGKLKESKNAQNKSRKAKAGEYYKNNYYHNTAGANIPSYKTASGTAKASAPFTASKTASAAKDNTSEIASPESGNKLLTVFGWILLVFGLLSLLGAEGVSGIIFSLILALGGAGMLIRVVSNKRKVAAFKRCLTVSGSKGIVDMNRLSATLGMKGDEINRTVTEMIDRGYYGQKAYIDHQRGLLVIDPEEMRTVYEAEDRKKQQAEKDIAMNSMNEYEKILAQIQQADDDIEDEIMSAKIQQIRSITDAIFKEVDAHPEKKSQLNRFMNYYLPTTLKLLNSYARIEKEGVSGNNMAKAKSDIEGIADTLIEGYEKQLDNLYHSEAVDIASDVTMIEKMMQRDGLNKRSEFDLTIDKTEHLNSSSTTFSAGSSGQGAAAVQNMEE